MQLSLIAWDETYKLGFNVTRHCDSGRMLIFICYYFPRGNMMKDLIR
ncbi:GLIPR1-like protein [Dirofilaria immitis]